VEQEHQVLKAL
jgi:hypothetical protein